MPSRRWTGCVAVYSGGAATGFAAVFNTPISGALFDFEVLLKEFTSDAFAIMTLATVSTTVKAHLIMGERVFVAVLSTIWAPSGRSCLRPSAAATC